MGHQKSVQILYATRIYTCSNIMAKIKLQAYVLQHSSSYKYSGIGELLK